MRPALVTLQVLIAIALLVGLGALMTAGAGMDATARPHMPDATCPEGSHGR